ncbi:MAG: ASPIC/UnbV domain-containing protein, partial [Planctomycetota bacterium]
SHRAGVGARGRVVVKDGAGERSLYKTMGEHGSFGTSPLELHLGLGAAARVERLEVFWPVTGETQVVESLAADQHVRVIEGEREPVLTPTRTLPFPR